MTELKDKFKRICERSAIKKRHVHVTEEILQKNPNLYSNTVPSLTTRQEILVKDVPELGKEAALKAIKEWGQPVSKITHLIFVTSTGIDAPSADYQIANLLNLQPSVARFMIYQQGCFGGGNALRLAKDLAENNNGARVLVVCAENLAACFTAPSDARFSMLVGHAIFGDGAAAAIIGAVSTTSENNTTERPLFRMVLAAQKFIPGTRDAVEAHLGEMGLVYSLSRSIPSYIGENVEKILEDSFGEIGISDWNSLFYVVHPGGRAVLDVVEEALGLKAEKLRASRQVLSEYGNMWSPTVLFVMDEMRKKAAEDEAETTGDGLEWGVLLAFGPGLTVETIVLHSVATASK
ncbi:hypothetical protein TIFTF001_025882 [Ficus carica]|uniref:Chalcone synthase n=1 Tax=Ficus carica TaxID=3494 RepID=A0AA88AJT7_FICCA|nr:hypothetical protein TIFTF001_025882 [Ficus carica]